MACRCGGFPLLIRCALLGSEAGRDISLIQSASSVMPTWWGWMSLTGLVQARLGVRRDFDRFPLADWHSGNAGRYRGQRSCRKRVRLSGGRGTGVRLEAERWRDRLPTGELNSHERCAPGTALAAAPGAPLTITALGECGSRHKVSINSDFVAAPS